MSTRIQLRRDSAANWTANNPVLAEGEPGVELDTGHFKIGDGVTAWNALGYRAEGASLDEIPPPVADVSMAGHRLLDLADAMADTDALNRETGDARYDAAGAAAAAQAAAEAASDPTGSAAAAQAAAIAASAQGLVPTGVKTTGYTAAAADFAPVDISANNVTITLPSAPADKTRIGVKVVKLPGTPGSKTCTIAAGGSDVFNIAGGSTSLVLSALFQGVLLQYKSSSGIWYVSTADSPIGVALGAAKLGTDGTVGGPSGSALAGSVITDARLGWVDLAAGAHGAVGDGKAISDGAITAGQATLTSAQAAFTSADVGKTIIVSRAGPSGNQNHLVTTILSVAAGVATLNATATSTVTGAICAYGTDDTAAVRGAIDELGSGKGGTIYGGSKIYIIAGALQTRAGSGSQAASWPYKAQLPLPAVDWTTDQKILIRFLGDRPMANFVTSYGQSNTIGNPVMPGFTLLSTLTGAPVVSAANGWACLIGGVDPQDTSVSGNSAWFTNVRLVLENAQLICPENPSLAAVQAVRTMSFSRRGVRVACLTPTVTQNKTVQPGNGAGFGILEPFLNNDPPIGSGETEILDYFCGIRPGEHSESAETIIHFCYAAIDITVNNKHTVSGRYMVEHCAYVLCHPSPTAGTIGTGQGIVDLDLDIETFSADNPSWMTRQQLLNGNSITGRVAFTDTQNLGVIPWTGSIANTANGNRHLAIYDREFPVYAIGSGANPAFGTNWANFSTEETLGFWVDDSGLIHIQGEVQNTSGSPNSATIFTLPVWWRPSVLKYRSALLYTGTPGTAGNTPTVVTVSVGTAGNLVPIAAVASNSILVFDDLRIKPL